MSELTHLQKLVETLTKQVEELKTQVSENHEEVIERLNNLDTDGDGFTTFRVDE